MSLDATRWAWQQVVGKPSAKLVLLSLADRADENHAAFPAIARLQKDTELDRKTIIAALQHLESLRLLSIARVSGKGNRYQLVGVVGRHDEPVPETVLVPKTGPVPKMGLDQSQKRDHTSPKNGTLIYQEPIKEPTSSATRAKATKKPPSRGARLQVDSLPDDWCRFCLEHRPDLDPELTFQQFRDFWIAQPGQKGVKLDWLATWRNWVRSQRANKVVWTNPIGVAF